MALVLVANSAFELYLFRRYDVQSTLDKIDFFLEYKCLLSEGLLKSYEFNSKNIAKSFRLLWVNFALFLLALLTVLCLSCCLILRKLRKQKACLPI